MNPLSLYIHIPFCIRKCLFCSFTVAVAAEHRADEYISALLKEAQAYRGRKIKTLYLGGGTPSLLTEGQLRNLMDGLREIFRFENDMEITIEANPETITEEKARTLKQLGFDRVSLGVQTNQDRFLKFLGRNHDAAGAINAYHMLRAYGFKSINVDLMFAFPGQTMLELEADVHSIASLHPEHMSLYTLTIEPNSRFYAKQMKLDNEEKIAEQYSFIIETLKKYGLSQYEVSNFAKEGFESKHNSNYWMGGEYIALGVGAHGYLNGRRFWNVDKLQEYLSLIKDSGQAVEDFEDLSAQTQIMEKVLFGLRTNRGIAYQQIPHAKYALIQDLIAQGFLIIEKDVLKATDKGRLVLDHISIQLI